MEKSIFQRFLGYTNAKGKHFILIAHKFHCTLHKLITMNVFVCEGGCQSGRRVWGGVIWLSKVCVLFVANSFCHPRYRDLLRGDIMSKLCEFSSHIWFVHASEIDLNNCDASKYKFLLNFHCLNRLQWTRKMHIHPTGKILNWDQTTNPIESPKICYPLK